MKKTLLAVLFMVITMMAGCQKADRSEWARGEQPKEAQEEEKEQKRFIKVHSQGSNFSDRMTVWKDTATGRQYLVYRGTECAAMLELRPSDSDLP